MRDFNTLCRELRRNLLLCGEVAGTIYWYEGTIDMLDELLSYARGSQYEYEKEVTDEHSGRSSS